MPCKQRGMPSPALGPAAGSPIASLSACPAQKPSPLHDDGVQGCQWVEQEFHDT